MIWKISFEEKRGGNFLDIFARPTHRVQRRTKCKKKRKDFFVCIVGINLYRLIQAIYKNS